MNMCFEEGGFIFDFSNSLFACQYHGGIHDLADVDFVIDTTENLLFIEVKNPLHEKSTSKRQADFAEKIDGDAFPYQMGNKFKDTLLRRWACNESLEKPIVCIFILELPSLSKTEIGKMKNKIHNRIPFSLNKAQFLNRRLFDKFYIMTVDKFRNEFPQFTVTEVNS